MKRINYLEINLIKEVEDLYFEICKTLLEELKKTQINGKIFHAHGLEELALSKCPYYLKQSTDSVQTLSKSQGHFSQKQNKKF